MKEHPALLRRSDGTLALAWTASAPEDVDFDVPDAVLTARVPHPRAIHLASGINPNYVAAQQGGRLATAADGTAALTAVGFVGRRPLAVWPLTPFLDARVLDAFA